MYKLYTDKTEIFECDISLSGASLSNSKARLVVETANINLLFNGTIDDKGKCKIPVKKLKGLVNENIEGNIKLEVIADDTYFIPWESEFKVKASKSITVEVKSQRRKITESSKPKMKVNVKSSNNDIEIVNDILSEKEHVINIMKLLINENINIKNLTVKKNKVNNIIAEYTRDNYIGNKEGVISKVVKVLSKRK